jgi:diguanylate cyclase (GGDEF)-like protein
LFVLQLDIGAASDLRLWLFLPVCLLTVLTDIPHPNGSTTLEMSWPSLVAFAALPTSGDIWVLALVPALDAVMCRKAWSVSVVRASGGLVALLFVVSLMWTAEHFMQGLSAFAALLILVGVGIGAELVFEAICAPAITRLLFGAEHPFVRLRRPFDEWREFLVTAAIDLNIGMMAAICYGAAHWSVLLFGLQHAAFVYLARDKRMLNVYREQAEVDGLTGVASRRHFFAAGARLIADAHGSGDGHTACVLMCDIDHFKRVNDIHGHLAGDDVLRAVAETIASEIRGERDLVARFGGEEFVVLLPHNAPTDAMRIAERVRSSVEASLPQFGTTISIGVAPVDAGESLTAALEQADRALYNAKFAGRNCVRLATDTDYEPAKLRLAA